MSETRVSKTRTSIVAAGLVAAMSLAGCAQQSGGVGGTGLSKQTVGAGVGAVGGALIGSTIGGGSGRTVAIIAGGLLGALAGSEIGRTMDENDQLRAERNRQAALETYPSGGTSSWRNPDSGYGGSVTPRPAYETASGETCREYTETIRIDGRNETAVGVACRNADGTWRVVNG